MTVTVYSQPNCQPCRATYRKLDELRVPYTVVNLLERPDLVEGFKAEDLFQSPIVVVERHGDRDAWAGHRPDKLGGLAGEARG